MYNYVNGFRMCTKDDGSEFILVLTQAGPSFDADGKTAATQYETAGSFVMSFDVAKTIAEGILDLISAKPPMSESNTEA